MTGKPATSAAAAGRRSPTLLAFLIFVSLFGLLFVAEIAVLFYRPSGVPVVERGERARLLGEVAGQASVTQTFQVGAGGLSGVTVEARPFGDRVSGFVVFTLRELDGPHDGVVATDEAGRDSRRPIFRVLRLAAQVAEAERARIEFDPIDDSKGRRYQLRIEAPDTPAGQGLGFWATRDQAYPGGLLTVDGREQWGDLVFRAHATRATLFPRIENALRDKPAWLRSRFTIGFLIVLYNWAFAAFTWYMLFVRDEDGEDLEP